MGVFRLDLAVSIVEITKDLADGKTSKATLAHQLTGLIGVGDGVVEGGLDYTVDCIRVVPNHFGSVMVGLDLCSFSVGELDWLAGWSDAGVIGGCSRIGRIYPWFSGGVLFVFRWIGDEAEVATVGNRWIVDGAGFTHAFLFDGADVVNIGATYEGRKGAEGRFDVGVREGLDGFCHGCCSYEGPQMGHRDIICK